MAVSKGLKIGLIILGVATLGVSTYLLVMKSRRDNDIVSDDGRSSTTIDELSEKPPINTSVNSNKGNGGKTTPRIPPKVTRGLLGDSSGLGGFLLGSNVVPVKTGSNVYKVHKVVDGGNGMVIFTFHNRPSVGTIEIGDPIKITNTKSKMIDGVLGVKKLFIDSNGKIGGVYIKPKMIGMHAQTDLIKLQQKIRQYPELLSNIAFIETVNND